MSADLSNLTDADRQVLETWVTEFERHWDKGRLATVARLLPPVESPMRRVTLVELIKVDLKRQWERGLRVTIESYLMTFPELGSVETVPVELIQTEYAVRQEHGASATWSDFAERFRRPAGELSAGVPPAPALVETRGVEATGDVVPGNQPTLLHPGPPAPVEPPSVTPPEAPGAPVRLLGQFGRYRIVKQLGQGGMGTVYLAQDSQLKRQVALKVPSVQSNAPRVLARFYREAEAAATLEHPNICPVYDVGECQGVHYLTMAYIEGKPLSAYIRPGWPLPQRQAAERVHRLALALEEAHRKGVVHRDLKPSNIMINQRDEPVIMDFGLALLRSDGNARLTQSGVPIGTPSYMAPEQVKGEAETIGPRSDIYSLGVIFYELLTGRLPFLGTLAHVLARVLTEEPVPPSRHRPDLDPELESICLQAMAKDPAARIPTMEALATLLAEYLQRDSGPTARNDAPPPEGTRAATATVELPTPQPDASTWAEGPPHQPARSRGWLVAVVLAGLLLPLALVFFYKQRSEPSQAAPLGTLTLELNEAARGDPELAIRVDGKPQPPGKPLELAPGKHKLQVSGRDFDPLEREFEIVGGSNPPLRLATAAHGWIRLNLGNLDPTDDVRLDDKPFGLAALAKDVRLPVGKHRLTISGKDVDNVDEVFLVQRGNNLPVNIKTTVYGRVKVELDDPKVDYELQVDERPIVGAQRDEPFRLRVGEHRLRVSGAEIDALEQTVRVERGHNPAVVLRPAVYGSIKIDWGASNGIQAELDGQPLAAAKRGTALRLRVGKHSLVITGKDIDPIDKDFTVKRGGDNPSLMFEPVLFGTVKLELSEPNADVEVQVNGQPLSSTKRNEPLRLPVGKYQLKVTGAKYQPLESALVIERGVNPAHKLILRPKATTVVDDKRLRNSIGMDLVRIPAGRFVMGSPRAEEGRLEEETQHTATIAAPFCLGTHEVTVGAFKEFVKANGNYQTEAERDGKGAWRFSAEKMELVQDPLCTWKNPGWKQEDDYPVVCVSWNDARAFCAWLSKKEGKTYRLPTEAEWECACRAGGTSPFHYGESLSPLEANFNGRFPYGAAKPGQYLQHATKTGSYQPNAHGLFDMHGNVWEWCADYYHKDYTKKEVDPDQPPKSRVLRGGSWYDKAVLCRSAYRSYDLPDRSSPYVGFRVVCELEAKTE